MSNSSKPNAAVRIGDVTFANDRPIALFAGPCQMESRAHALEMASALKEIAGRLGIGLVYKTSFDKANRTSLSGKRGLGLDGALAVFAEIRETLGPARRHRRARGRSSARASPRSSTCCRSRPSCAARPICSSPPRKTGRVVKVKKGQFLAPWDMRQRGRQDRRQRQPQRAASPSAARSFGYNTLVVRHARPADHGRDRLPRDLRRHPRRAAAGRTGHVAPAATGASCRCWRVPRWRSASPALFIETHQDPDRAPSDGPNMVPLEEFEGLLRELMAIDKVAKRRP